ncbi:WXG100 family type VII secretion target [Nocardiopsis sp. EMB25]|uniref:WXG100 family type VII secretion target n=1 Tax=Nocardiopsis TaxID=2013 RepID=UPI00034D3B53|nr:MULTISPECIES: WXG100 family type VII secretion target [Nocardiopsis]MCY9784011.1 WXG100 family type VII secretion target [Nocardiopsis sp. EMB25]
MDGFDVSYAYVDESTQQLRVQTETVANAIENLDMQMQTVRADLEGATAEAYDAKVKQWRLNVADMRTLLGKAEMALNQIRNNYSGTDSREAVEWASLM